MNDVQHVEAARKLAERVLREGGSTTGERRRFLFASSWRGYPDTLESQVLDELFQKFYERFRLAPTDAEQLLSFGESTRAASTLIRPSLLRMRCSAGPTRS